VLADLFGLKDKVKLTVDQSMIKLGMLKSLKGRRWVTLNTLILSLEINKHPIAVDDVAKAISRFESYTKYRDFKAFHFEQAVGFKSHFAQQKNKQAGKPLSKAALNSTLGQLKTFFQWLAIPIRTIFKESFELADLPYFNPHSFRNTLVTLGQTLCQSPEEFKSWSQNLGHADVLTTLYSYGEVQQPRQGEIFQQLKLPRSSEASSQNADEIARAVVKAMANQPLQIGV